MRVGKAVTEMLPLHHDPHFTFRFADDRITDHELGPIPELLDRGEARDAGDTEPLGDDALDFPFGDNVATTEEEIPF